MEPLDEYDVDQQPLGPDDEGQKHGRLLIAAVALLVVVGVTGFVLWRRAAPDAPPEATTTAPTDVGGEREPLGPSVEPIDLPPLALTDPLVRELLGALSSRPEIAAWLASDGLIRNFVVSVENVATGPTPSRHLRRLSPTGAFEVVSRGGTLTIDPQSYERYDELGDTVSSLDAQGLAKIYSTLKPRLQEAYAELGHPDSSIDDAVERAIVRLLEVPLVESPIRVRPHGATGYQYEDGRLEALTPAQKQLLRMGPRNIGMVQDKLRQVGAALGISAERLRAGRS